MLLFTPENVKITSESWIISSIFHPYLESIAEKFQLRRETRQRTHRLGKVRSRFTFRLCVGHSKA
jgi:hypothetical protein